MSHEHCADWVPLAMVLVSGGGACRREERVRTTDK